MLFHIMGSRCNFFHNIYRIFLLIDEPSSQLMHRLKKDVTCLVEVWKVLVLERSENWLKGGSIPSLRHSVVDEERMRLVGDFHG